MRRWIAFVLLAGIVLAVAGAACTSNKSSTSTKAATPTPTRAAFAPPGHATFDVRVGAVKGLVVVNQYLPKEVTVREGDTVRWTFPVPFVHTVSFYGDQPAPSAFLSAERADHRPPCPSRACGPVGDNPAVAYPRGDPRAFDGSEVLNSGILPGEILHQAGGDTFEVTFIKAGTYHYIDNYALIQGTVNVVAPEEGPLEPHVVTFTSGGEVPANIVPEPQDTGPPRLPINPRWAEPAGGNTYDGTGYVNSGLLGGVFFNPDVKEWSLKFTAAGEFAYVCPVHYALGMTGTIVVTE